MVTDKLHRPLRDLRVSVTDRCNFRCTYCMPKEVFGKDFRFLPRDELLTFEEITRLSRIFAGLGVEKIRLTGGEPLLRRDLEKLIEMLAKLDGIKDLTLTTNGSLLAKKARALKDAGLHRLTVSLDSLDEAVFAAMNDVDFPVAQVLEGIEAVQEAGFSPIKINMVVKRGVNDHCILGMVRRFRDRDYILRFIEYMDVGSTNGWKVDEVVSAQEIIAMISAEMPLEIMEANYVGEVATRYRHRDSGGEIGVISSVTQPFCSNCTRARLSSEGLLYKCLFATGGHDLRSLLRNGLGDGEIIKVIQKVWAYRDDRYSEIRSANTTKVQKVEMSHIGG